MKILQLVLYIFLFSIVLLAGDNPRAIRAVRIIDPPKIDGHLNDSIWSLADVATDFNQRDPDEGQAASERSEIRVLYDHEALYFGCIFFDSEPDKIVARLTRRDNEIESDRASIRIDSYHDHQTGYEFTFNVAGVKVDILQYDDANREDESWDPVWYVETQVSSSGWSAEVKIPFRILRYRAISSDTAENVLGINFLRYISRKQEWDRWAFSPKSQSGFISRFGHLVGLRELSEPQQLEVLPFITTKQNYQPESFAQFREQKLLGNTGLDLKYGISSSFTLDATVNPDFGQVEADPAVLNLSTFETFYPEKRPFFIEGTQIIRFTTFGGDFGPGMFYSRRVGRAISTDEVDVPTGGRIESVPQNTTILGAAKLSGKTNSGLSVGVLQAFTEGEKVAVVDSSGNRSEQVLEPFAHYNVIRLKQDVLDNSNVGMIVTSVAKHLRYPAFTNGYDWSLKFDNNTYLLSGFLALSHTTNENGERVTGSAGKVEFLKIAGEHWLWSSNLDYTSKHYNINDIGFFRRPNDYGVVGTLTYKEDTPAEVVRNYNVGLFLHERRNFDEVNLIREARWSWQSLFLNYWKMNASAGMDVGLYDDRETRGNGLYRKPKNYSTSMYVFSDEREVIILKAGQRFGWDSKSKKQSATEIGFDLRPLSWMEWEFETEYQRTLNQEAWVANDSLQNSIFADRSTQQFNFNVRSTITFTRELTLQLYGQLFLAKGQHENFRRLIGTSDFQSQLYNHSDFNNQALNTNLVLRWEYHPGSTLYMVWSQARDGGNADYFNSIGSDFSDTFSIPPTNVFLLKVSYWWSL